MILAFKFTTEKIRVDEKQLTDAMILSASFHMVCTPARCMNLVKGIIAQRECLGEAKNLRVKKPLFVWVSEFEGVLRDWSGVLHWLFETASLVTEAVLLAFKAVSLFIQEYFKSF